MNFSSRARTFSFAVMKTATTTTLLLILGIQPGIAAADLTRTVDFNIPAQLLPAALLKYSEQSGVQVTSPSEILEGRSSGAVVGSFPARSGLERLLTGTDLGYEVIDPGTVAIRVAGAVDQSRSDSSRTPLAPQVFNGPETPDIGAARKPGFWDRFRLAQADQSTGRAATQTDGTLTTENETNTSLPPSEGGGDEGILEDVVVTGTHIRGLAEIAAPSLTITRQDMQESGLTTLQNVIESIPQNFGGVSSDTYLGGSQQISLLAGQNVDRAASVDLRGLGAQSTLTLLNGTRRAGSSDGRVFDLSAIPLSAVERVEIVTGGRSAIYGADAVAGVVNIISRRDFDGFETDLSYGMAPEGGERLQLGQLAGARSSRGGIVFAYDYQRESLLNVVDTGLVVSPSATGVPVRVDGQPDSRRHAAMLSGTLNLNDRVRLYADAYYTSRTFTSDYRFIRSGATNASFLADDNESEHISAAAATDVALGADWSVKVSGSHSDVDTDYRFSQFEDFGFFATPVTNGQFLKDARLTAGNLVAEGPLWTAGGVTPRLAVGAERRSESLESIRLPANTTVHDRARNVSSAFAEMLVPLHAEKLTRLELSIAGRYDDYSDFGSSFNPQAGLVWQPLSGISLRGAYSTAFRAPALADFMPLGQASVRSLVDPTSVNRTPVLVVDGNNPDLGPEEAQTWSVGIDYEPTFAQDTRISMSYFEVRYQDRINLAAAGSDILLALVREDSFRGLVDRQPTAAQIGEIRSALTDGNIRNFSGIPWNPATQDLLTAMPNLAVFDNRIANISVENVRGIDFDLTGNLAVPIGTISYGVNATFTIDHDARLTDASPVQINRLNEVGKPVDLRVRADIGFKRGPLSAFAFVNYTDSYSNPLSVPPSEMNSWTTLDLSLLFDAAKLGKANPLMGLTFAVSVTNVLDKQPPAFLNSAAFYRYDTANANPFGRYATFRLSKSW